MTSHRFKRCSIRIQQLSEEINGDSGSSGTETDGNNEQRKKTAKILRSRKIPAKEEELPCCSSSAKPVIPKIPITRPPTKDRKMLRRTSVAEVVVVPLTSEENLIVEAAMKECKHEQILRKCHDEAQKRQNKLEEEQKERAWKSLLANTLKNNRDSSNSENETLGVWSFPKKRVERAANPDRRARKQLPPIVEEPAAADECLFTVTEWNGKRKGQNGQTSIPSVKTPEHLLKPRMMHWTETPVNIRVEDGEYLPNYPYLDGEVDIEFENKLFELYGSKDFSTAKKESMPDKVFLETINDYEKSLVAEIKKTQITRDVRTKAFAKIERHGVLMPSRTIFSSMTNTFQYLGFPFELEKRYAELCKGETAVMKKKPKKVPECVPASDATNPNLNELLLSQPLDTDPALTIYKKLFCPRCLMYCCLTHDEDDNVDPKYLNNAGKRNMEPEITCAHEDCVQKPGIVKKAKVGKSVIDKWDSLEITTCNLLYRIGNHSICYISSILGTKTCRQILKFVGSQPGGQSVSPTKKDEKTDKGSADSVIDKSKDVADKYIPTAGPVESGDIPQYKPCIHADNGVCNAKNGCYCVDAGTYCEWLCNCSPDCPRRFKGCNCKSNCSTQSCPCFKAHRECDPRYCGNCGSENQVLVEGKCENVGLYHHREKKIELKVSKVAGWGGFIGCDVKKGEYIAEYRGELLTNIESDRRALYYEKIRHTYLFSLNESLVIDATRIGSKVRFINSSKRPNCYPRVMMVNGDHRIGLYAKVNLNKGEELFFDYENIIKEHQKGKGAKKPRKCSKKNDKDKSKNK